MSQSRPPRRDFTPLIFTPRADANNANPCGILPCGRTAAIHGVREFYGKNNRLISLFFIKRKGQIKAENPRRETAAAAAEPQ